MSMTAQEAIKRLRAFLQVHPIRQYPAAVIGDAFNVAIDALREKAERDDPKPLTFEELHNMIGEPVWVQGPGLPQFGRWAIVEDAVEDSLILVNDFTCHGIGETWEAYRHRPKEG